jgi:hypothetical protein
MISQLSMYGVLWIVLPLVVFAAAREGGWHGAVVAHLSIALLVIALHVRWIANHGLNPGTNWLGATLAITLQLLLINSVLLPLSLIALGLRHRNSGGVA